MIGWVLFGGIILAIVSARAENELEQEAFEESDEREFQRRVRWNRYEAELEAERDAQDDPVSALYLEWMGYVGISGYLERNNRDVAYVTIVAININGVIIDAGVGVELFYSFERIEQDDVVFVEDF